MDNKRIKYPRTFHLPWSEGRTSDDKVHKDISFFYNKRVIVSEKMDGENSTLYNDYFHARSLDSNHHESRSWLKAFHSKISYLIMEDERICGENLFAKHSIHYTELQSYFYGFSFWRDNICLSWDETLIKFKELGIEPVNILYDGIYDEEKIKKLYTKESNKEGYVVRIADSFLYEDFSKSVAKFVRKNHVQTSNHWMNESITPNTLKK